MNNKGHVSIKAITYGTNAIAVSISLFLLIFGCYALTHGNVALGIVISLASLSLLGIGLFEILNIIKDKSLSTSDIAIESIRFVIREHDHHSINNVDTVNEIRDIVNNYNVNR